MTRASLRNLISASESLAASIESVALAAEQAGRTPLGTALKNLAVDLGTQRRRLGNLQNVCRGLAAGDDPEPPRVA